ncbi:Endonuclease/exonuclease/phosphatase [Chlorobium limicola DSM 245]|uniref:Endonuclease/exonuclease/phosphatase n=1 Tax=Chlorobium limicola (strain DSM 245 / NBRC 103803 / 6330) TaxID=290315 RepID=B3ECH3_CHLL2|nr:endonuclease/exonuclease/phosphatase family protein [Chlorobium limicola]ACD90248.1 Endonuclease/exonuclease/phosphatase [Chlorobium limicola DSM 245]
MKKSITCILLIYTVLVLHSIKIHAGEQKNDSLLLMWWNVENLFDTHNDPDIDDEEFTPEGRNHWTQKKLALKRLRIKQVLDSINTSPEYRRYPDILAFAETENRTVFAGILKEIGSSPYKTLYIESPDKRGIDIGLAYNPQTVRLISSKFYIVPVGNDKPTRHIIIAGFSAGGHPFRLMLNHWPSRAFDKEWTEQKRITAAKTARHIADSLRRTDATIDLIIMGDFNDEPENRSIKQVLGSSGDAARVRRACSDLLYNCWSGYSGIGSYSYRNNWERIDQILLSCGMLQKKGLSISHNAFRCFYFPNMLAQSANRPYSTYHKGKYKGGYSDHLPLLLKVDIESAKKR